MAFFATTLLLALTISVLYSGIKKYIAFRRVLASIKYAPPCLSHAFPSLMLVQSSHFPGITSVFADTSILAFTAPSIPGIVHRRDLPFRYGYELYKRFGADMFTFVCIFI